MALHRGDGDAHKLDLEHYTFVRAREESAGGEYSPAPSLEPVRRGGPGVFLLSSPEGAWGRSDP